jgi:ABC-type multidrug transport system fused ATPase/permease subunit
MDDTLRNNIAFGLRDKEIDESAISRAVEAAQLSSFVASLPDGLSTNVGERGVRLSGGQSQRIGIARALYHDPPVLVLDEASSALDTETEAAFMAAVNCLRNDKTIVMVTHRLSTVSQCDELYEVAGGSVIKLSRIDSTDVV